MPGNITFQTARSGINSDFFDVLNSVALVLNEFDKTVIEVAGHTDNTGPEDFNQHLSEKRATSVGEYLKSQGIPEMRVLTLGHGELRPIATNTSAGGRQQNRRVELTLAPLS
jgi:outer membrane protein OmpA-like peptidoglycan-associated protein